MGSLTRALVVTAVVVSGFAAVATGMGPAAPSADEVVTVLVQESQGQLTAGQAVEASTPGLADVRTVEEAVERALEERPTPSFAGTGVPPFVGLAFVTELGFARGCQEVVDLIVLLVGEDLVFSTLSQNGFGVAFSTDPVTGKDEHYVYSGAALMAGDVPWLCFDTLVGALAFYWADGVTVAGRPA